MDIESAQALEGIARAPASIVFFAMPAHRKLTGIPPRDVRFKQGQNRFAQALRTGPAQAQNVSPGFPADPGGYGRMEPMRPVFEYLDYRGILKDAYEERKASSPLYSYRMLAESFGLDTGNVFRILQGDAHLPARCQSRAIEFLGLSGRSAEYFLLLIAYARERNAKARTEILEKAMALRDVARRRLVDRELDYYRNWWSVGVRSLLEVTEGRARASEIASRLVPGVGEDEVRRSLELLLELGLVRKAASGKLVLSEAHLTAGGDEKTEAVRGFQRQILALASESLERFPKELRDVSTITFAVDRNAFVEIREMLRECRRQIQKRIEESERPDRVMQLAMALFPLAPAIEEES